MASDAHILNTIIKTINKELEKAEYRIVNGNIKDMEDYKFNRGMRDVLLNLKLGYVELTKGGDDYASDAHILNGVIKMIDEGLQKVDDRILNSKIENMIDYKSNSGMRHILLNLKLGYANLTKGDDNYVYVT